MKKTKTVNVKAAIDDNGYIKGYASTWTREPDFVGDVVMKGAFADCLARMKENNETIPLLFNHNQSDLDSYIGKVDLLEEDEHGLLFGAPFYDTEKAQRARELAQDGALSQFSFAYDILDQAPITLEDGRKANELRKLNIHEVSLVLTPCNPDTSMVDIKSNLAETLEETAAAIKAGRRNSEKDADELRRIADAANEIIETVNGLLSDTNTDPDDGDDKREDDPEGAKSQAELVAAYKQAIRTYWE